MKQRIKNYITKNPKYSLVKHKHDLNLIIIKMRNPVLKDIPDKALYKAFKDILNIDRVVRKAKEELKKKHLLRIDVEEEVLLKVLQQEVQMELGYGTNPNQSLFNKAIH